MKLDKVAPLGRALVEYRHMFNLTDTDLNKNIIGVGDGPASFNAEMNERGNRVLSIDPLYRYSPSEIESQFHRNLDYVIYQIKKTPNDWVWSYHKSPDHLRKHRIEVLRKFIGDFEKGKAENRYVTGELPKLAIPNQRYDIALCSHFLFLYSDLFDYKFHFEAVIELLRVANDIRIFPILSLNLERSPHLDKLIKALETNGYDVKIHQVKYELQKGGNEMLQVIKAAP